MVQTCVSCTRANPAEAAYCYQCGRTLAGQAGAGHLPQRGKQTFPRPFVFPSGRACRDFDQLTTACHDNWPESVRLLHDGYLAAFLGNLGRADLAQAAREAAQFPDPDRGLDQLLARIPSDALPAPKLAVEPSGINLGILKVGETRMLSLRLRNQGARLVFGSVTCEDCPWLVLGEAPGLPRKLFQFGGEHLMPIHLQGRYLRASNKPLEGRLLVESNAGTATVVVRAQVPVIPFATGVLAGATTPRELAGKAKNAPKDAAPLFEKGEVAQWYKDNGWNYPVRGLSAQGPAAIQQFFEALGLTAAPKVEIAAKTVVLRGKIGELLEYALEVTTREKKPVYAHGSSDQPWLGVGRSKLSGRSATVPLVVPSVPDRAGETLLAKVTVLANGNQRFVVPVTLEVNSPFDFRSGTSNQQVLAGTPPSLDFGAAAAAALVLPVAAPLVAAAAPPRLKSRIPQLSRWLANTSAAYPYALPAALGLVVLLIVGLVYFSSDSASDELLDRQPRLKVSINEQKHRFGLVLTDAPDARGKPKRLTADERGSSNNTCLKIDGSERLFGLKPGQLNGGANRAARNQPSRARPTVWEYPEEKILVTQTIELIPGEQSRLLDTCSVRYKIENRDSIPHQVGLRMLLDTLVGTNDGAPFQIPGLAQPVETMRRFGPNAVPSFLQAHEGSDLRQPGVVAEMGLKLHGLEPIESLLICRWPGNTETRWEWTPQAMNDPPNEKKDACVALYWAEQTMAPGSAARELGFTYGLGTLAVANGRLGLAAHGATRPGGEFTVIAVVQGAEADERLQIQLPAGLQLPGDEVSEKALTASRPGGESLASWRIQAMREGVFTVEVADGPLSEKLPVRINTIGIFD